MENIAIINYPGSKKRLLDFIFDNTKKYLDNNKIFLDIFAGTGCVAQFFKDNGYLVSTNDTEVYSYHIANAILNGFEKTEFDANSFDSAFNNNRNQLINIFKKEINEETNLIKGRNEELISFDLSLPKIWSLKEPIVLNNIRIEGKNDLNKNIEKIPFSLFTLYYSGSYFGLKQSIDIDSLRYAIEKTNSNIKSILLTCLYYAMKEASFSKDGHMAQPLNHQKNFNRLIATREKNIYELFLKEFEQLNNQKHYDAISMNYNMPFEELIQDDNILKNIGMIYADPPYTDMQYSRYFHLLTTVSNYCYPDMTLKNGKLTSGLYANNRFQSSISNHKNALSALTKLIIKASSYNIPLVFSYGYPINRESQPTDRYTMNIDDLIQAMKNEYKNVLIFKENFKHCNNRNSSSKKVFEYLIIGLPQDIDKKLLHENNKKTKKLTTNEWGLLKKQLSSVKATNKSPLYNSMLYWSQKPYTITDALINFFTTPGDIIMDPFMGSGVTILEASSNNYLRKSIGIDINDMPIFLCKNSILLPDKKNYEDLLQVKETIIQNIHIYDTKCEHCGNEHATITKIIYDRLPKLQIKEVYYDCPCSNVTLVKCPSSSDYKNFLEERAIKNVKNISLIENSRISVGKNEKISDKFSNRSLFVLDTLKGIIEKIKNPQSKIILSYIYASIIHKSKILDVKLSSQWPLWIPKKNCVERNVITVFLSALDKYVESRTYVKMNYSNKFVSKFKELKKGTSFIIQKGIQNIKEEDIPSASVDFIITDPPYLGQVPYSEYMQLYKGFLDNQINFDDEIVITNAKTREKDYKTYFSMMKNAFKNISRMLKDDAIMCLYFHDSDLMVWSDLIDTFHEAGFAFENCMHIDKPQKTLKKILDPKKTMSGETLLFLRKAKQIRNNRNHELSDFENIKIIAESIINASPSKYATTSQLYDNGIMGYIINEGILHSLASTYKDLTEIFNQILSFQENSGVWRLQSFISEPEMNSWF